MFQACGMHVPLTAHPPVANQAQARDPDAAKSSDDEGSSSEEEEEEEETDGEAGVGPSARPSKPSATVITSEMTRDEIKAAKKAKKDAARAAQAAAQRG